MAEWKIAGSYVSGCACQMICACPVGGHPTGPDGQCFGCAVFNITSGNFGDVDLSGVKYAFYNRFPTIAHEGNWTIGVIVDESASSEQANAIDEMMQGKHGGPFGEWVAMVAEYKPMERAKIDYSETKLSISGHTDFTFEPFMGADGSPTTVKNAPGGAAHEFQIGKTSGVRERLGCISTSATARPRSSNTPARWDARRFTFAPDRSRTDSLPARRGFCEIATRMLPASLQPR